MNLKSLKEYLLLSTMTLTSSVINSLPLTIWLPSVYPVTNPKVSLPCPASLIWSSRLATLVPVAT